MKKTNNLLLYYLHCSSWEDYKGTISGAPAHPEKSEVMVGFYPKLACVKSNVLGYSLFRKDLFFPLTLGKKKKSGGKNPES